MASQLNYRVSSSALAMLMGVPQEDGLRFKSWHEGMVSANASGDQEALGVTFMDLMGYVQAWMEKTKAEPGGDDLMSALMEADIDGRPLTNEEIFGTFILLIVGGFETTADVTSATLAHLAEDHELREQLRANPKLITKAVGEFARVFAPTQATARTATRDVEIGGRTICAGERVLQMWASGSRDEDVFPDPDKCDIDRPGKTQLTSFGSGNHRCLGEGLARIEIRAILSTWLERIDTFKVDGNPERGTWPTQGWHSMPMSFTARS
ncbi:cytochrome P450 [Gordonia sp. GONU]|uniref:cytochrome P450 n=1 Tax=Gordonia sp. GONU TaxID=2972949 RepID=UPI0021ACECB1|nr:cytochrome P450 [Gordonia sp. GONU]MCR8896704.1 cytochrome P450 [Gordonia sp. GONU]